MFDTALSLKYNEGHWKWYSEYYYHEKFKIYHIYSARENRNVNVFDTYWQSAGRPNTDHYLDSHQKYSAQAKLQLEEKYSGFDQQEEYSVLENGNKATAGGKEYRPYQVTPQKKVLWHI